MRKVFIGYVAVIAVGLAYFLTLGLLGR